MMAKPMKTLELHYPMIQFLIILHIRQNYVCFGDLLPMRTLCDAYHRECESH